MYRKDQNWGSLNMDTVPSFIPSTGKSSVIISVGFMLLYILPCTPWELVIKDKLYCIFVIIHLSISDVCKIMLHGQKKTLMELCGYFCAKRVADDPFCITSVKVEVCSIKHSV